MSSPTIRGDPAILFTLTKCEELALLEGRPVVRGRRVYVFCRECSRLVRLNKPIVGCLHLCA